MPLVLVNGQIVLAGRLPVRDELKRWSGVDVDKSTEDFPPSCCNVPRMP
ncbi:arsenic metallochaperone ArsD family protein [Providencia sp.]